MSKKFQSRLSWAPLAIPSQVHPGHYSCKLGNLILYVKKSSSYWKLYILSLFLDSAPQSEILENQANF